MFGNHMNIQTPGLLRLVDDREVDGKKLDILQGTWSIIVKTRPIKILLLTGIYQELIH